MKNAMVTEHEIEAALSSPVACGESVRWYLEQAFPRDDEQTRSIMVREIVREILTHREIAAGEVPSNEKASAVGSPVSAVAEALQVLTDAARDVLAERERQKTVEGWTAEHDDEHAQGEMAAAAAAYALGVRHFGEEPDEHTIWPWDHEWWKPKDDRSNLIRAGALILAEIERLDRARSALQNQVKDD